MDLKESEIKLIQHQLESVDEQLKIVKEQTTFISGQSKLILDQINAIDGQMNKLLNSTEYEHDTKQKLLLDLVEQKKKKEDKHGKLVEEYGKLAEDNRKLAEDNRKLTEAILRLSTKANKSANTSLSSNSSSPSSDETQVKFQSRKPDLTEYTDDSFDSNEKIVKDNLSIKHQRNVYYDKEQLDAGDMTYPTAATGSQTISRLSESQQTSESPPSQPSN